MFKTTSPRRRGRREFVKFIVLTLLMVAAGFANAGASADSGDEQASFKLMKQLGLAQDYEDGRPHLDDELTRAQVITVIVQAFGQGDNARILQGTPAFQDTAGGWYSGAVAVAKHQGWVHGYPDGTFHPEEKVTYAELLAMLDGCLGLKLDQELPWPANAINPAVNAGIVPNPNTIPTDANARATRGIVFHFANQAFMTIPLSSGITVYQRTFANQPDKLKLIDGFGKPPVEPAPPENTGGNQTNPSPPSGSSSGSGTHPSPLLTIDGASTVTGDTSAAFTIDTSHAATLYYSVVRQGAAAPSDAQIMAGMDGDRHAADRFGSVPVYSSPTTLSISPLPAGTSYTLYVLADNGYGNRTASHTDFATAASSAPMPALSIDTAATVTGDTYATFELNAANTAGLYYVVVFQEAPVPSDDQIIHGSDGTGNPAIANGTISGSGSPVSLPITGLTPSAHYQLYVLADNGNGGHAVVTTAFDTLSSSSP